MAMGTLACVTPDTWTLPKLGMYTGLLCWSASAFFSSPAAEESSL